MTRIDTNKMGLNKSSKFANTAKDDNDDKKIFAGARDQKSYIYLFPFSNCFREQSFMALNLTVKSTNLLESLEQFVRGELLDGDNAYFCEKCQEKRSAIKRMCIRQLPKTLVIQLKRFHYDYETNRAVKFDDHFEFPRLLDMGPYTTEGIKSASASTPDAMSTGSTTTSPGGDGTKYKRSLSMSRKSKVLQRDVKQPYDLVGVVVHSGQANAGHYYSFIKNRYSSGEKWFKFNDTTVEEVDMNEDTLKQECFGKDFLSLTI